MKISSFAFSPNPDGFKFSCTVSDLPAGVDRDTIDRALEQAAIDAVYSAWNQWLEGETRRIFEKLEGGGIG